MSQTNIPYSIQKDFNIRCLTAGISIKRETVIPDLERTVEFLHSGKKILESEGYFVQMTRLATNPFPEYIADLNRNEAVDFIRGIAEFTKKHEIFLSIGPVDPLGNRDGKSLDVLCEVLSGTSAFAGIHISNSNSGILQDGIEQAADTIIRLRDNNVMANFQFAALANIPPETPFFPAAFHRSGDQDTFSIGTESASLVLRAVNEARKGGEVSSILPVILQSEFKELERVGFLIQERTGWAYDGLDTSPAPMKDVSIGRAIEGISGVPFGAAGTLSACAQITGFIKSVEIKTTGYCGLMLPVMEDEVLAQRAAEGTYSLMELLSYSAVCGTGLDVIPLPGNVIQSTLENLLLDIAALASRLNKPLSARLIPIPGKEARDEVKLDSPYLVPTRVFSV
ncbi:DUF711 family protein [Acidobacteriota bacterium]